MRSEWVYICGSVICGFLADFSVIAEDCYVDRHIDGKIKGVYALPQKTGHEKVQREDPEVQAYLNPVTPKSETDKLNDKINALLAILGVVGTAAIGKTAYDKLKSDTEKA